MPKKKSDNHSEHHTEIHLESHSEQHVSGGNDQAIEDLTNDLKRVQAEFVNYKRRADEERGELIRIGQENAILKLLPVRDNISQVITHLPLGVQKDPWAVGLLNTIRQTQKLFDELGVSVIDAMGKEFDPNLHDAIAKEGDGNHVTEIFQPGYMIGDRVLRHAIVRVGDKTEGRE